MKRHIAIIVAVVVLALPLQAQVKFGLKGGLNLTEMSLNNSEIEKAISNKSGFFIGPTVKITLPIVGLGIDAAALYDKREGRLKVGDVVDEKLKQESIQVPINLRWGFGLGDVASVFIFAGPQFGFSVGGDNSKASWSLKKACISANAGLGLMLVNHLQLSVNYNFAISKSANYGIYNVDGNGNINTDDVKVKNNAWQIALAYYF
jgi:hypothetical protein